MEQSDESQKDIISEFAEIGLYDNGKVINSIRLHYLVNVALMMKGATLAVCVLGV